MSVKNIYLMSRIKKVKSRKRAVSELIAYVLLISLAVSLSSIVYIWLRFYVQQGNVQACPDGVSVILKDYNCNSVGLVSNLSISIQNKGLFAINGTSIFIENDLVNPGLEDTLPANKFEHFFIGGLKPSETAVFNITYAGTGLPGGIVIRKIALLPFRFDKANKVYCDKAVVMQNTIAVSNCI